MRLTKDKILSVSTELEKIIIQLLFKLQDGFCGKCNKKLISYQVHHKRYGEDIGIKDLVLLCGNCHAEERGVKSVQGTTRKFLIA